MHQDHNPARRLYKLLVEAKQLNDALTVRQAWAKVFHLEDESLPAIFYNLVLLQQLVSEVEDAVQGLDVDHTLFLQHMPQIKQILSLPNFDSDWGRAKKPLTEAALVSLQFCSERLSRGFPEKAPHEDEIQSIKEEVDQLYERIISSTLKPSVRSVLLEMVEAMRRAISEYRIRGMKGLRQELFSILERFQRNFDLLKENRNEPEVSMFWKVLGKYDTLTSVYLNTPQIIAGFQALLPG